ncbi:MAG: prephenate dehydrogenase [Bacteroidales bacterium]|jgi:prephenate dehydrogenase
MNIVIIGVGLIGGSMALSLRGFQTNIIGVDNNPENAKRALELGLVDKIMSLDDALKTGDLIIVAVSVDSIEQLLPRILNKIKHDAVVVDMGSTKQRICEAVKNHQRRNNFVASHPIAGTEYSGPDAALSDLFTGKVSIICEKELSSENALTRIKEMYKILKMRVIYMNSKEHDKHIAYVSHLSHITSFVLSLTVFEIEKSEKNIFNLAGSGFASTVRLAKSSPDMWSPILEQNSEHLSKALTTYINFLNKFKTSIEGKNRNKLHELIKEANVIKKVLK